jgi:Tfp pilus assembly protein PilN
MADDLRDKIAEALALQLNGQASDGRGWYRTAADRIDCYARADAALAVVGPELERLRKEVDRWRDHDAALIRQAEAERDAARAESKQWHDTYQQHANDDDAFLGELLDLLPGSRDTGSDAYDQIPRGIKALRAERDKALTGVLLVCCDERHAAKVRGLTAELERLRTERTGLVEATALAVQWTAQARTERDALKAALEGFANILDGMADGLESCYSEYAAHSPRALVRSMRRTLATPTPTEETDRV